MAFLNTVAPMLSGDKTITLRLSVEGETNVVVLVPGGAHGTTQAHENDPTISALVEALRHPIRITVPRGDDLDRAVSDAVRAIQPAIDRENRFRQRILAMQERFPTSSCTTTL